MDFISNLGYVRVLGTLRVIGQDKYVVTNVQFGADQ
jgi:hypothetical protein